MLLHGRFLHGGRCALARFMCSPQGVISKAD
uniref:Uncharacterized protein n=1 Tax=Siphoviridae sp. ctNwR4 TaxID=2825474 RepID=A0A8S5P450_9CAUD|nr:MAG TPA: hypothetical protein [Siphoviridae sp. ctNwR4]